MGKRKDTSGHQRVPLMTRIPKQIHQALKKEAKKQKRSLNTELVWILYRYLSKDNWALTPPPELFVEAAFLNFIDHLGPTVIKGIYENLPQPRD